MLTCPGCGQANPDGFRMCGMCGASLGTPREARVERKVVTVLFCDLVGFTRLTDETLITRPGDAGWIADIIEDAWARWCDAYPAEWRTVEQAIPYVHLRYPWTCDRPMDRYEDKRDHLDLDNRVSGDRRLEAWDAGGRVGPRPEEPKFFTLGHTHAYDHGICLDPWLVEHASTELVLKHELAHAISGTFGHGGAWFEMCAVIGYELTAGEKEEYAWQAWADAEPYEDPR